MDIYLQSILGSYAPLFAAPRMPIRGELTWNSEGVDSPQSQYYSRRAHWPGGNSGITIGRGYDLGSKNSAQVLSDLITIGLGLQRSQIFSAASGIRGKQALHLLQNQHFPEISAIEEQRLFARAFLSAEEDARRLLFGTSPQAQDMWLRVPPPVREVLIDLRYRGDLTASRAQFFRQRLQHHDLESIIRLLLDRHAWVGQRGLSLQRFEARRMFILQQR